MTRKERIRELTRRLSQVRYFGLKPSFLENQEEWKDVSFGWHPGSDMARTGCGIFAVWNVLFAAKRLTTENAVGTMAKLIADFERFGAVFGGRLGVSVASIYIYLKRHFPQAALSIRHNVFAQNVFGIRYDAVVATAANNRKKPWQGMHTVCISKQKNGFVIHNAYRKNTEGKWVSSRVYPSLSEALSHITENPFFVVMIGVLF